MANNPSPAAVIRRKIPKGIDDFPTPPWVTRLLIHEGFPLMEKHHRPRPHETVSEPAANRGYMVDPLSEWFDEVYASDLIDYGRGYGVRDYPQEGSLIPPDWVITNPPFTLAEDFLWRALDEVSLGVFLFIRSTWAESLGRYKRIFSKRPPTYEFVMSQRATLVPERLFDPKKDASGAMAFSWFCWIKDEPASFTRKMWLPPKKDEYSQPEDGLI